ncbi:unnamed protein product [Victoria cruziana]
MLPSFHGLENEDPYRHLDEFLDIYATVRISHIEDDALRLQLFPFSLKEKAKHWFKSLPTSVRIATWDDLQNEFLKKYFPISKTNHFRKAITTFSALEGETFHQAWERMKELLRRCPHHQIPRWQILQGFYDGLTEAHRQTIDSSCGGYLMLKSEEDAWMLFDTLSENSLHSTGSSTSRQQAGKRGVLDIGTSPHVQTQLDSLSRKMDQLLSRGTGSSKPVCGLCDSVGHVTDDCPIFGGVDAPAGQVNAAQGFSRPGYDPYSTSYNPEWRNHPNFGWRNTRPQSQIQSTVPPQRQTTYSQPSGFQGSSSSSTLEERLMKVCEDIRLSNEKAHARYDQMLDSHSQTLAKYDQVLGSHLQSLQKLEQQVGQIVEALSHRRVEGSLPSQPLGNPKGKGPVFVVEDTCRMDQYDVSALRSGREYQQPRQQQEQMEQEESAEGRRARSPLFSRALEKPSSVVHDREVRMQDMLEMFRAVRINLSLVDAISQVPAYARFLKELYTKKRRSRRIPESIMLSEETSFVLLRRMPPKLEDPGAPIIQCIIRNIRVGRALLDLGASVNVLPGYFYDAFQLEGLQPTSMTIQLADRSVKSPRGVLEDILLKIEDFVFLVDFVILDMEGVDADHQTPIILGRPFLATANVCINCRTGVLEISFGDQKLRLNIFHAGMRPASDRCISFAEADDDDAGDAAHEVVMSTITSCVADPGPDFLPGTDILAMYDSSLGFDSFSDLDLGSNISSHDHISIVTSLDHSSPDDLVSSHSLSFEGREADGGSDVLATTTLHRGRPHPSSIELLPPLALEPESSSLESPPVMELKPLPHTLKYTYLGSDNSLSVIISSVLSSQEENRLLAVLRGHKKAIGWKVADLRGINPAFC